MGKKRLDLLNKDLKIRFAFQKEYLPSLCKMALNMIKNGSGKTKFEVTAIIQIRENKDLKQNIYNCEDLRYIDEAELIEND